MKTVQVRYTVKPEYVETNKQNIGRVMQALRDINNPDLKYSAFLLEDSQTFVHIVMQANEEAAQRLQNLAEFNSFRQQLRASQPISPPKSENLTLVDTSWQIF